jgi:hypothetical protein
MSWQRFVGARYMDPGTGRFVSEDPSGSGMNWHMYCGGDPVSAVDPDGRMSLQTAWSTLWFGAAVAFTLMALLAAAAFSREGRWLKPFSLQVKDLAGYAMWCFGTALVGKDLSRAVNIIAGFASQMAALVTMVIKESAPNLEGIAGPVLTLAVVECCAIAGEIVDYADSVLADSNG